MKKNHIIAITLALSALTGVCIFIYSKFFSSTKSIDSGGSNDVASSIFVGDYIEDRADKKYPVHFATPRPAMGTIQPNEKVEIRGNVPFAGTYNVEGVWTDASGKLGAIYLPLQNWPAQAKDSSFSGKFVIVKL